MDKRVFFLTSGKRERDNTQKKVPIIGGGPIGAVKFRLNSSSVWAGWDSTSHPADSTFSWFNCPA